jgi:hypothetical protein
MFLLRTVVEPNLLYKSGIYGLLAGTKYFIRNGDAVATIYKLFRWDMYQIFLESPSKKLFSSSNISLNNGMIDPSALITLGPQGWTKE